MGIQLFMDKNCRFDVYRGDWSDDKPNGKGTFFYQSSGIIIEGLFKEGSVDN